MIVLRPPIEHPFNARKIVLMSGLSNPESCHLSAEQVSFLEKLNISSQERTLTNFPYLDESPSEHSKASILRASLNNGRQFISARKSPYQESAIEHWRALAESCEELIVVTLSCGLEILNVCCSTGIQPAKLNVIALGPVARHRPLVPHRLIRGSRDFVSFPFFPKADMILPKVGHMNYLESETVLQLVQELL